MEKKRSTVYVGKDVAEKAKAMGINMSETLDEALKQKFGMKEEKTIAKDKDGNLVVDAEFTEFLEELKVAFEKYFKSVTYKYQRKWARSWLNARLENDGFSITKEQKEDLLESLEETIKETLREQWARPKLEIGNEKLKEMKEIDYANFLGYVKTQIEKHDIDAGKIFAWIKVRTKKYGGYYTNVTMYRDFLMRYMEEVHAKGEKLVLPIKEWLSVIELHVQNEKNEKRLNDGEETFGLKED